MLHKRTEIAFNFGLSGDRHFATACHLDKKRTIAIARGELIRDTQDVRWKQRFQNYEKAYLSLLESADALAQEPANRFIQDSLIQRYAYTIELAWKSVYE